MDAPFILDEWGKRRWEEMMRRKKTDLSVVPGDARRSLTNGPVPSIASPAGDPNPVLPLGMTQEEFNAVRGKPAPRGEYLKVEGEVGGPFGDPNPVPPLGMTPEEVEAVKGQGTGGNGVGDFLRKMWGISVPKNIIDALTGGPAEPNQPRTAVQLPDPKADPYQPKPPAVQANVPPPKTADELMLEQIAQQRKLIDSIYPKRDTSPTAEQAKADEFSGNELRRTQLLAQLAFASGVTSAGGGSWEKVGGGLAAAGDVYDKGFARYQNTLQGAADRAAKLRDIQYGDELTRSEAALGLYSANVKGQKEAIEQRKKEVIEMFKATKPEGDFVDPEQFAAWMKRFERYIVTGEYEPSETVDVTK